MDHKINIFGDNLLLKRQEVKPDSEFLTSGDLDLRAPVFEVIHAGPECERAKVGDAVVVEPGHYDNIQIDKQTFTYAKDNQIVANLEVQK